MFDDANLHCQDELATTIKMSSASIIYSFENNFLNSRKPGDLFCLLPL